MEEISNLLKCTVSTVTEKLENRTPSLINVCVSAPSEVTRTTGYGAIVGMAVALLIYCFSGLLNHMFKAILSARPFKSPGSSLNGKTVPRTIVLSVLVLVLPLIIVFLLVAFSYKLLCSIIIKRKDKHFAGFLDSFDVFWSLEDDTAKSVINVLGIIESESPCTLVNNIKEKLRNIFPNDDTDKIFFRRKEQYGFYYWRRYSSVDINQYVEIVELPAKPALNMDDLENLMTEISSQSLPYNDEGLFKILITKQRVGNHNNVKGEYGIVFRIHHSVGDGVALIEFLCKTLADNQDDCPVNMFSNSESHTYNARNSESPTNLVDMIEKLWKMPICLVDGILRTPDDNSLHRTRLLNKRIFTWTESDENLLLMVKEIKENVDRLKFTDVLAAALSSGLHNFFTQTMTQIPKEVAVVLPVRFPHTSKVDSDLKLENDFSVTILDLPVNKHELEEVQDRCDALRKSVDPLANFYLLKALNSVLPKQVLQPILYSRQATMVFSNLPGPRRLSICGGNVLKKLVFFVPQRGNTGIGVTALCYDGVLRFGAAADTALVAEPSHLALILDGMVAEIRRLHQEYVR